MVSYKIEVFCPEDIIDELVEVACQNGAGKLGDYDHISAYYEIKGTWRPLGDSNPVTGEKNEINHGCEYKVEFRCKEQDVSGVLKAIRAVHPYELAVINVIKLENHRFE